MGFTAGSNKENGIEKEKENQLKAKTGPSRIC